EGALGRRHRQRLRGLEALLAAGVGIVAGVGLAVGAQDDDLGAVGGRVLQRQCDGVEGLAGGRVALWAGGAELGVHGGVVVERRRDGGEHRALPAGVAAVGG